MNLAPSRESTVPENFLVYRGCLSCKVGPSFMEKTGSGRLTIQEQSKTQF